MGFFENLNHSINVAAPLAIKMRQEAEERALREKIEEDRFKMQLQRFDAAAKRQEAQDALARIKTADTLGIPLTPDALTAAGLPVPQTPVSAENILPGVDPAEYLISRLPRGATVLNQEVIPGAQVPAMEGPINEMDRVYDQDLRSKISAGVFVPPPTKPEREAKEAARKHREELEKIVLREDQRRETRGVPQARAVSSGRGPSGPSGPSGPGVTPPKLADLKTLEKMVHDATANPTQSSILLINDYARRLGYEFKPVPIKRPVTRTIFGGEFNLPGETEDAIEWRIVPMTGATPAPAPGKAPAPAKAGGKETRIGRFTVKVK